MISAILYDKNQTELKLFCGILHEIIAKRSEDESRILACGTQEELLDAVGKSELNDFCCLDFKEPAGRNNVGYVRRKFPASALLLIVDQSLSPRAYIRPDIMASSVVLRPFQQTDVYEALDEFVLSCLRDTMSEEQDIFRLETKEGVTKIPYESIAYIEASAKKVFIRLKKEEYGFYGTLDNLEKDLPEYFMRCHRGFIVNLHMVRQYAGAENVIYLQNGLSVPISRSYKGMIREKLK